jgi:hypothetical protein
MESSEDFEFVVQTLTGERDVVISRSALSRFGQQKFATADDLVANHKPALCRIVERKIAKGKSGSGQIRLHATDL